MIIAIVGPPCSGKTTLARRLATERGFPYISSGDIARELAESDVGVKNALEADKLAPLFKMDTLVLGRTLDVLDGHEVAVLDGYPRYLEQLLHLVVCGHDFHVITIFCTEEISVHRARIRARDDGDVVAKKAKTRFRNQQFEWMRVNNFLFNNMSDKVSLIVSMWKDADWFVFEKHVADMLGGGLKR